MRIHFYSLTILFTVLIIVSCGSKNQTDTKQNIKQDAMTTQVKQTMVPVHSFSIVKRFPHDTNAFTQGLVVVGKTFYESTGLNGKSSVRIVDVETGRVLSRKGLDARFFGEGLSLLDGKLFQITWLNQQGFIYDSRSLLQTGTFEYMGEGWGITTDGNELYMSNGTPVITVRDPKDFSVVRTFGVVINGHACDRLNELEWVDGELWANVWQTNTIVRIDPQTGHVNSVIDCTGILPDKERAQNSDVMNGIAYDKESKSIYVTGKNWPWVYQISVK